jgi:DNA-directed RNA polymerase specialized sigma24 family protein
VAYNRHATLTLGEPSSIRLALARAYGRAFADLARSGPEVMGAQSPSSLQRARLVLSPAEAATLDLLEGKGFTVEEIAGRTGCGAQEVMGLYRRALDGLVADLETCDNDRVNARVRRNG